MARCALVIRLRCWATRSVPCKRAAGCACADTRAGDGVQQDGHAAVSKCDVPGAATAPILERVAGRHAWRLLAR
eukprot:2976064-Prymnesium_polylepis.1